MAAPQELFDALTNVERSLRLNFRKRTFSERSPLEPKLNVLLGAIRLHEIFSFFQKSMEKVDRSWHPKGRIEQVVRTCINGRYQEGDLERIFYEQGGIAALLVLHLGTRNQTGLCAQIYTLPMELREELARQCGCEEINPFVQAWIGSLDRSRTEFNPLEEPLRIDRFAKEKAENGTSTQPPYKRIRTETNKETGSVVSPPITPSPSSIIQPSFSMIENALLRVQRLHITSQEMSVDNTLSNLLIRVKNEVCLVGGDVDAFWSRSSSNHACWNG